MQKIITLALLFVASFSFAQNLIPGNSKENGLSTERLARIDQFMDEQVANNLLPGAVVFLARNGKIILHKAYGYSDVEAKSLLKKEDIFRIASQSKAITSLAAMMLFEEGKFSLDDHPLLYS